MKKTLKLFASMMAALMLLTLAASAYTLIDSCDTYQYDTTPRWGGTYVETCTDDIQEGEGYVIARPAGGVAVLAKGWEDHWDLTEYTDGYFSVMFYTSDAASITSGALEMSSGTQTSYWDLTGMNIQDGWNQLSVKIATGSLINGGLDFADFTGMRVYAYSSNNDMIIGLDNMGVGMEEAKIDLLVDNCDRAVEESTFTGSSWSAWGAYMYDENGGVYTIDDEEVIAVEGEDLIKEGNGSLYAIDKNTVAIAASFTEPYDFTAYPEDDTYLMFWLYLSDGYGTSLGGQIEITSGGAPDVEEISWSMAELSYVQDGWNPVALPLSTASTWMDGSDLSAINSFRLYDFVVAGEEVEIRIDQLGFGTYEDAVELGFIVAEEETEEATEEATEEVTEEETVLDTAIETEEVTEEVTEEATEEVTEEETAPTAAAPEAESSPAMIVIIVVAAIAVIAIIIVLVVVTKKKKN